MTSYEMHPYQPSHSSGAAVIEPVFLPDIPPGPTVKIDDYARIYGPPHIRELGYWGVGVSIVGALFMSSGLCLQKVVHHKIASNPLLAPASRHTLYIAGVAYVGIGLALKALVDILLPQSASAPLSAQTILYTSVLEYLFLDGGDMKRLEAVAFVTIAAGIVLATFGANTVDGEYSLKDLLKLYERAVSIIATASMAALLLTVREIARTSSVSFSDTKGLAFFSIAAGMFAGWLGTVAKSLAEVVKYAFLHGMRREDASHSGLWLLILAVPVLGIPKLRYVGNALLEFHPTQFLPCYQAAAIAANAVCGIIYFNDFGSTRIDGTHVSLPMYLCGTALTCFGTLLLASRYNPQKHVASYDTEESRSLLFDDDKASLLGGGGAMSMSTYDDEFGARDLCTPNGKMYAHSNIVVKSSGAGPYRSSGLRGSTPSTPRCFGRPSGDNPSTPSHSGPRTPESGTPGRASFVSRSGSGVRLAPGTPGGPTSGSKAATPGRSTPKTPSTPLSPFSAVAKRGYGIEEAMALAQMQGSHRTHRRVHSGQTNYADLRDALSPFENDAHGGLQMYSPAKSRPMQALYVGSMQGLDIDGNEMVWEVGRPLDDDGEMKEGV